MSHVSTEFLTEAQINLIQESIEEVKNTNQPLNEITITRALEDILVQRYKTPKNLRFRKKVMNMSTKNDIKRKVEYYFLYHVNNKISHKNYK